MLEKQISLLEAVSIEILLKQFEASETMSMSEHESVEDSVASNDLKYSLLKPFTLLLLFSAWSASQFHQNPNQRNQIKSISFVS